MSRPLGVVVVGVGFIADAHIAALAAQSGARLTWLVDAAPGRLAAAAHRNGGVRATTDLAEALASDDVDAVIVCTPNDTHAAIALQVAAAGKHLLVEKPLAITVADARAVADAFSAAGLTVMAAHTHRSYDYARTVKQTIESGELGRVTLVRLAVLGGWIWPDWHAWVLEPARSGGHPLHNGVHLLDLAAWWLGTEPRSVHARGARVTSAALDIDDHLEMVLTDVRGATAICEMSRAHRPASFGHRDLLVVGTEGVLQLDWQDEAALVVDENGVTALPAATADGFAIQLAAWLDAIAGEPPVMPVADAVTAVALAVAAQRSIETGEPVLLGDLLSGAGA
ncbi:Gfo/Idh/MocA family protein [Amycolatopsis sp. CA-230715]|uniref:Gfo/Idh/MocA family protein n=1 Tax=Amycolatopsis sp. CA-230715 TaxID=2745196 RepID=UPI001C00B1E3|nr:Gfo/Idh/MocA family oxidoreductase [Amycolatopsis sp. CA-230715]QWF84949.1 Myo-inositol 2-dehydrogenase [Amycolatopsis sp. CA-230715]